MGRPRATRPRYRRISAAATSALVTAVAVLGGTGLLPTGSTPPSQATVLPSTRHPLTDPGNTVRDGRSRPATKAAAGADAEAAATALPADSGEGKRIVFDMSDQRVWLVSARDKVVRSYLVSGSVTDNLRPGTYAVYSKSRWAVGVDDSGVMQYMVRFTHGDNAAIGFHDIPTKNGRFLQTRADLGTPQSHGCIRQWRPDAKALWAFAPVDTEVDVVA